VSDRVLVEGLQVEALVGVYDHERDAPQPLLFDLELSFDNRVPAVSDAVADTVDYAAVCETVRRFVSGRRPRLLETLAEGLAEELLRGFAVEMVRVRIRKPFAAGALGAASVGVEIVRRAHTS
jgi:dihydroneopterin aldolase